MDCRSNRDFLYLPCPRGPLTPTPTPTGAVTPVDTPTAVAAIPVPTYSYFDCQVTNGRGSSYQVEGLDSAGMLGLPTTVAAAPFAVPDAVPSVNLLNLHSSALDLTWNEPFSSYPIVDYRVERALFILTATPTGVLQTSTPTPTGTPPPNFQATVVARLSPVATVPGTSFTDASVGGLGSVSASTGSRPWTVRETRTLPTTVSGPGFPRNLAPDARFFRAKPSRLRRPRPASFFYGTDPAPRKG